MKLTNRQTLIIATVAGVAVYYCEWLELITPFCNQGLQFTLISMYVIPLLVAAGIGYIGYKKPMICWLLFMMPSSSLKVISLLQGGGNLAPPLLFIEFLLLILTGLIIGGIAIFMKAKHTRNGVSLS